MFIFLFCQRFYVFYVIFLKKMKFLTKIIRSVEFCLLPAVLPRKHAYNHQYQIGGKKHEDIPPDTVRLMLILLVFLGFLIYFVASGLLKLVFIYLTSFYPHDQKPYDNAQQYPRFKHMILTDA